MAATQAVADRVAIDHLQRCYADAVTCRDWPALEALFCADATVTLDLVTRPRQIIEGPSALVGFIKGALERYRFFQFVILNSRVDLWPDGDSDAATARLFMCELRHAHGADGRDDAYGLYRDAYRRTEEGWRIASRRYRSLARYPDGEVFGLPDDL